MSFLRRICVLLVLQFVLLPSTAGAKFLEVLRDTTYTPLQFVDQAIAEYGGDLDNAEFKVAHKLATKFGRNTRLVAIKYGTVGPDGKEMVASGVVAFPTEGRVKGVVEVFPVSKGKSYCASVQMFATELAPAVIGYITIIPDMIGFGLTADMPVCYFNNAASVTLAVDMRKAAEEYLELIGVKLPSNTEIFGYSLGSANAFALACHYSCRPWMGVKVSSLFLGGGAYNPISAIDNYKKTGIMEYMILPGIVESVRHYHNLNLNLANIFKGRVLDEYQTIVSSAMNGTDMYKIYGSDLHAYMHDDFFSAEGNEDINLVKEYLSREILPLKGQRLSPDTYVNIRHAKTDAIVPVICSDDLAAALRPLQKNLRYRRDRKGTHYSEGANHFYAFLRYLIFSPAI